MKTKYFICLSLILSVIALSAYGSVPSFDRYKVIIDKKPFGKEPPPPPDPPPNPAQSFAKSLQLTALLEFGEGDIRAGILDAAGKTDYFLKIGEEEEGIELMSVDLEKEEVVLRKGSEMAVLKLHGKDFQPLNANEQKKHISSAEKRKKRRQSYRDRRKKRQQRLKELRERKKEPPPKPKYSGEELEQHLQDYQMEVLRKGLPPLPIPLTEEMDDQLVEEGVLPPVEEDTIGVDDDEYFDE